MARKPPPKSAWASLAGDFRRLSKEGKNVLASLIFSFDELELRAGKMLCTCLEAGMSLEGWQDPKNCKALRRAIDKFEEKRGRKVISMRGPTGLEIGPVPPRPGPFSPPGRAVLAWMTCVFDFLVKEYPDCFDGDPKKD